MNTTKVSSKVNQINNANESKKVIASIPLKKVNDYKQSPAKNEAKKESEYKTKVLDANKELKKERLKLGYCIDDLLKLTNLDSKFAAYLKKAKKDSTIYKTIETNVKKTKKGFNAFYLLQYLHKNCK
jgi:hypothetical protein